MFGNLVLWIKKVWQQQTCVHDYKEVHASWRTNGSCPDFKKCKKCEYLK